jgi:uncharacterized protein (DUF3084 family)
MADLRRILRTLTEAAARFEHVTAHRQRVEAERKALQEAITNAQLALSVKEWPKKPLANEVKSPEAAEKMAAAEARATEKARNSRAPKRRLD